jgi:hypothetical protein
LVDLPAEFERPGRRNETASGLTNKGSPVVSRNRASARLIAEGLSRNRSAARKATFREQHIKGGEQA